MPHDETATPPGAGHPLDEVLQRLGSAGEIIRGFKYDSARAPQPGDLEKILDIRAALFRAQRRAEDIEMRLRGSLPHPLSDDRCQRFTPSLRTLFVAACMIVAALLLFAPLLPR